MYCSDIRIAPMCVRGIDLATVVALELSIDAN